VLFNQDDINVGYVVPKDSGVGTIYSSGFWIGGLDVSGSIHISANKYPTSSFSDFEYGPIADVYDLAYVSKYNKIWNVSNQDIQDHINGVYSSSDIIYWPGNGDTTNGESFKLAPFKDLNANAVYEPNLGEYPLIKGDHCMYIIFNDDRGSNGLSGGDKLGVEVHAMIYQHKANNYLKDATFVHYTIFNRSNEDYHNLVMGQFADYDLGNPNDDYIGTSVSRNTQFSYNGDNLDEAGLLSNGYGNLMPAQGITFLNNTIGTSAYFRMNGTSSLLEPQVASEYYQYMTGKWKDNTSMVYGGNGHSSHVNATNMIYPFMFDGDVTDLTQWNETMLGALPEDRRGVLSTEPMNLLSEKFICLDMAFTHNLSSGMNTSSVTELLEKIDSVQIFYDAQSYRYRRC